MTRSEFDFERLSAALDGRLNTEEQATLDADLAVDKALRSDWEELQSTVRMLNAMPAVQPPRSFTLDPAVYGKTRRSWVFPWTRWAAVVGAIVLMVVVGTAWINTSSDPSASPPLAMNSQESPADQSLDSNAAGSGPEETARVTTSASQAGGEPITNPERAYPYQAPNVGPAGTLARTSAPAATSWPTQPLAQATAEPTGVAAMPPATQAPPPVQPTQNIAPSLPPPMATATESIIIPATQAPPIEPAPTQPLPEAAATVAVATEVPGTDAYPVATATIQVTTMPDLQQTPEIAIVTTDDPTALALITGETMESEMFKLNPISPYTDPSLSERFFRLVWFGYDLITAGTNAFNQVQP